ncbi:hypothetical protein IFM89_027712, partial [Coptis chinensis]
MVNPWKTYLKLSVVLMGSHDLTKGSLAFLNYLAQLMFKSTKHPYVYGVLVFEAMATFIGQVSVLLLIALFGAATTAMHGIGLILIAMGIAMKLVLDNNSNKKRNVRDPSKPSFKEKKVQLGTMDEDEERKSGVKVHFHAFRQTMSFDFDCFKVHFLFAYFREF